MDLNLPMYTHSRPIPRREHKKSTTGCAQCRLRRVKCDEKRPVCGKCLIHFANIKSCEYRPRNSKKSASPTRKGVPAPSNGITQDSTDETHAYNEIHSLLKSEEQLRLSPGSQASATRSRSPLLCPQTKRCNCPCHVPGLEFTGMLLDAVLGICRLCGNLPSLGHPVTSCNPVVPSTLLMRGRIDPFQVLPADSSPQVISLIYHWINTLALVPTKIHSEYCTNPTWLSTAIANPALFHATLYVCSVHIDGLHGRSQSAESLSYKCKTIKVLNEMLRDPSKATSDETISAVLLMGNILSIIGEAEEVAVHLSGLQRMVAMRGGIDKFSIDGCFLHMLCTTNHLSAVLSESKPLIPLTGITYTSSFSSSSSSSPTTSRPRSISPPDSSIYRWQKSALFKPFAISSGFNVTVVEQFHDLGYLYAILDVFTSKFLILLRPSFEELRESIKNSAVGIENPDLNPNPVNVLVSEMKDARNSAVPRDI